MTYDGIEDDLDLVARFHQYAGELIRNHPDREFLEQLLTERRAAVRVAIGEPGMLSIRVVGEGIQVELGSLPAREIV